MSPYLLDNNVVSGLARREPVIVAHFDEIGETHTYLPVMAVAEIEEGLLRVDSPNDEQQKQQDELRAFLSQFDVLPFSESTIPYYSLLRAELWRNHGTRGKRSYKEKTPEQLMDRITGRELGIDERDLIIASIAIERGLILATNDRNAGMRSIEMAAASLLQKGEDCGLIVADWSKPPISCEDEAT